MEVMVVAARLITCYFYVKVIVLSKELVLTLMREDMNSCTKQSRSQSGSLCLHT